MIQPPEGFRPSYRQARVAFLEAAAMAGLPSFSYPLDLKGAEGEDLAMDVVIDGDRTASQMLVVSSGCHGVEGFCGSGVQVFALQDAEWRAKAREAGVTVVYVHALNPHGFSHRRRVTQENVDLNRNFMDFSNLPAPSQAYAEVEDLLLPDVWPPDETNQKAFAAYLADKGLQGLQQAFTAGQYQSPMGAFFGGTAPTWSNLTLRRVLKEHMQSARQLAWIDLHTGLGPNGYGERIFADRDEKASFERASRWWNVDDQVKVTSIYDGSSTSVKLTGMLFEGVRQECPDAEYTGIALEFGTAPMMDVMSALRADHWCHRNPGRVTPALRGAVAARMMDAFYDNSDTWKALIVSQSRQAMFQAVDGLTTAA